MGHILYYYYVKASAHGGAEARADFSFETGISAVEATFLPDTKEKVDLFQQAYDRVLLKHEKTKEVKPSHESRNVVNKEDSDVFLTTVSDLIIQRALLKNEESLYRRITESLVQALKVQRASVWMLTSDAIKCLDLFEITTNEHSVGYELREKDFPNYFKALRKERVISALDALSDTRTKEFSNGYLKPLNIISMLDVPIWVGGKMFGVLCCESIAQKRAWTKKEEDFVYLISNVLASRLEKK